MKTLPFGRAANTFSPTIQYDFLGMVERYLIAPNDQNRKRTRDSIKPGTVQKGWCPAFLVLSELHRGIPADVTATQYNSFRRLHFQSQTGSPAGGIGLPA